jgi:hypothetical protein
MQSSATSLFVFYGGLALLAGAVCWPALDISGVFAVGIAIYAMLVAANGIDRGEKQSRRR